MLKSVFLSKFNTPPHPQSSGQFVTLLSLGFEPILQISILKFRVANNENENEIEDEDEDEDKDDDMRMAIRMTIKMRMRMANLASTSMIVQFRRGSGCSVGFFLKKQVQQLLKSSVS